MKGLGLKDDQLRPSGLLLDRPGEDVLRAGVDCAAREIAEASEGRPRRRHHQQGREQPSGTELPVSRLREDEFSDLRPGREVQLQRDAALRADARKVGALNQCGRPMSDPEAYGKPQSAAIGYRMCR